jgi:hypothetical protein
MKRNIPSVPADCDVISFKYLKGNTECIFCPPPPPHEQDDSVKVNVFAI